jgi:hypothetical protein
MESELGRVTYLHYHRSQSKQRTLRQLTLAKFPLHDAATKELDNLNLVDYDCQHGFYLC